MYKLITLLIILAICFFSCECEELPIIEAETVSPFLMEIDTESDDLIILRFNKLIDSTSFIYNTSFFVENNGQPIGVEYTFQNQATYDEIIIAKCGGVACPSTSSTCELTLKLLGEGAEGIKSKDGQSLDGNRDGTDGGDMEETIVFQSCLLPQSVPLTVSGIDTVNNRIVISFNEHLDQSSVVLGSSLVLSGNSSFTVSGFSIEMQNGFDQIIIPFCLIECGSSDMCDVAIQLLGDGPNTIKSIAGRILDGDGDGNDGGNFLEEMNIPSCQDPFVVTSMTTDNENLIISFSKNLNQSSVALGSSFLVNGNNLIEVNDYSIQSQGGFDNILIPLCAIDCGSTNPCDITVQLLGNGSSVIQSLDGQILDGDMDGNEGGDYSQTISVNTCYTPFEVEEVYTDANHIYVAFNKQLDPNSVVLDETVSILGSNLTHGFYDFFIQNEPGYDILVLPLCDVRCGNEPTCQITLSLFGNSMSPMASIDGQPLEEGGIFSTTLNIDICTDPNSFRILDPAYDSGVGFLGYDDFFENIYTVTFSEPVDITTVEYGSLGTFMISSGNFSGSLEWNSDYTQMTFDFGLYANESVDLYFVGTDSGFGYGKITNMDGVPLDGDWNGIPGGDHEAFVFYEQIPIVQNPFFPTDPVELIFIPGSTFLSTSLEFNTDMDATSFIEGQTITLTHDNFNTGSLSEVPFEIIWTDSRNCTIRMEVGINDVCEQNDPCQFQLTLKGSDPSGGQSFIKSSFNGLGLDGDYDYNYGGDYVLPLYYPY